jgi:hypothetical protein
MDEIKLLAAVRPAPPADLASMRQGASDRLAAAMSGPPARPRRRRRTLTVAGIAAAACAAIVVPVALPSPAAPRLVTAAYAVQRHPDGTVSVSIRQLADPVGLQRALRAVGVPAVVLEERLPTGPGPVVRVSPASLSKITESERRADSTGRSLAVGACLIPDQQRYTEPASVQRAVLRQQQPGILMDGGSWLPAGGGTLSADFGPPASHPRDLPRGATMILHPSAMPPGAVVYLNIGSYQWHGTNWSAYLAVLNTTRLPQCANSLP